MGPLERLGEAVEAGHRVVLTGEREWRVGKEALHDVEGLVQALRANVRRIKRDPGLLVLRPRKPRSQPELETPFRQDIERGDLLGQHDRVSVVVREHQASDPQRPRHAGDGRERGQRGQLMAKGLGNEVVPNQKGGEPSVLGPPRGVQQRVSRPNTLSEHSETKGA